MEFIKLVSTRQSVRRYSSEPVEAEYLEKCLEASRLAPSASNSQPWHFIVVTDEPLRTEVAKATFSEVIKFNRFTLQAPVMVVIVIERQGLLHRIAKTIKNKEWSLIDIGIAAEHFCLQAAELGLGTCMLGWFDEKKLKQLLGISRDKTVALCISMGYSEQGYPLRKKTRKAMEVMRTMR
jgi:nitroreductase